MQTLKLIKIAVNRSHADSIIGSLCHTERQTHCTEHTINFRSLFKLICFQTNANLGFYLMCVSIAPPLRGDAKLSVS